MKPAAHGESPNCPIAIWHVSRANRLRLSVLPTRSAQPDEGVSARTRFGQSKRHMTMADRGRNWPVPARGTSYRRHQRAPQSNSDVRTVAVRPVEPSPRLVIGKQRVEVDPDRRALLGPTRCQLREVDLRRPRGGRVTDKRKNSIRAKVQAFAADIDGAMAVGLGSSPFGTAVRGTRRISP
jgi:hypothetical protein